MPAIDQQAAHSWTEEQQDQYQSLPFYLAKMQVEQRKTWATWNKFVDKIRWKVNQGDTMRAVRTNASPHKRQFAMPRHLSGAPRKDVMDVKETTAEVQVYRHRFESPALHFYPSFNDFMDHVDDHAKDINEKIDRFDDVYIRSNVWHMSPFVFVAQKNSVKLIQSPYWVGTGNFTEGTDGKTTPWLLDTLPQATHGLSMVALAHALNILETQLRIPFFSGSDLPAEDAPLAGKYALITSSETYNGFSFDPYLRENKNITLDIVKDQYRGSFFGRMTSRLEDLPLRFKADGTYADPELRVDDDNAYNDGETLPNDQYASVANSPYEVGFICGAKGYSSLEVGPPPSKFTGDNPPHDFPGMFWNAEVKATKQRLIKVVDEDTGDAEWEMNTYGEYLWFISQGTFGCLPKQRRNIIPLIYRRSALPSV